MKKAIFILLIVLFKITYAQKKYWVDNRFCLKISPLSLINYYDAPCLKLGTEIKIYKNIAGCFEYGVYINTKSKDYWWKQNAKGFTLKSEIKYYLNKISFSSGKFISAEYTYKKQDFLFWATIEQDTSSFLKHYNIKKHASCINIKYGELLSGKNRFMLEWYAGLGIWINDATDELTETERNNIKIGEGQGGIAAGLIRGTGHGIFLNITAGLKVVYKIK